MYLGGNLRILIQYLPFYGHSMNNIFLYNHDMLSTYIEYSIFVFKILNKNDVYDCLLITGINYSIETCYERIYRIVDNLYTVIFVLNQLLEPLIKSGG